MLAKSLQIITSLMGTALRAFAFAILVLECLFALALAALCFWIASDGSIVRGAIAAGVAFTFATVATVIVAVYFAALSVVKKAVSDAGLGRTIFNSLFRHALGVSGGDPGHMPDEARVPTHLSHQEVEQTLNNAARTLLSDDAPSSRWAAPVLWLAKQVQRISVWATVKVIVKSCSDDGTSVNMYQLRDRLASTIDRSVVSLIRGQFTRLVLALLSGIALVSIIVASVIRLLPF